MRGGRNKYHAKPTWVDGIRFHSGREARRYKELKLLQLCGAIKNLELQVPFVINVAEKKICTYKADFRYIDERGATIVEDSKGYQTRESKLKQKLFEAIYGQKLLLT